MQEIDAGDRRRRWTHKVEQRGQGHTRRLKELIEGKGVNGVKGVNRFKGVNGVKGVNRFKGVNGVKGV